MIKSAITYTLSNCQRCLKCLKACPTEAIAIIDNRVSIDADKCINCGKCVEACLTQGLVSKGSTLADISNYDYTVCLVPSALICEYHTTIQVSQLFKALKLLGFDEIRAISDIEAQVRKETQFIASVENKTIIASFCPVVNKLIATKYPSLLDNLAKVNYPSEIAAKHIRKNYHGPGKIGIFNCCECVGKLLLAKYPYGNKQFEVDHALAIADLFPLIKKQLNQGKEMVNLCALGLQSINPMTLVRSKEELVVDGFDKTVSVLELAEFEVLKDYQLLTIFPCFNGCLGGHLLWGNSFLTQNNIGELARGCYQQPSNFHFNEVYADLEKSNSDNRSMQEKLKYFSQVNKEYDKLPHYDCGACGFASCRIMAEEIAKGNKTLDDCHILASLKEKNHES